MPDLVTLHVFNTDFRSDADRRRLLDWCLAHAADTFTVDIVGTESGGASVGARLDTKLADFSVSPDRVPVIPKAQPGSYWSRPRFLWQLTAISADLLWSELEGDLLSYSPSGDAWYENPAFYRGEDLMLGVVSHESEGVLRIRREEQASVDKAGIPYRLKGEWVGY